MFVETVECSCIMLLVFEYTMHIYIEYIHEIGRCCAVVEGLHCFSTISHSNFALLWKPNYHIF